MLPSSAANSKQLLVAATAASLGAVAILWYQRRRTSRNQQIPSALLKSPYAKELKLAVRLALQGESLFC
jgi:hypothetical protein